MLSVSAGFWIDHRSSLTEMTGNKMTISIRSATIGIRLSTPLRHSKRAHRQILTAPSKAHARLRISSICCPDSTSEKIAAGYGRARLTEFAIPLMIKRLANLDGRSALSMVKSVARELYPRLLPPRSMVGQLTLDQHIGVRIPGGQPNKSIKFNHL